MAMGTKGALAAMAAVLLIVAGAAWALLSMLMSLTSLTTPRPSAQRGPDLMSAAAALLDAGEVDAAIDVLEPLANAGDAAAQLRLGRLFAGGDGVPADPAAAFAWTMQAAAHGDPAAQYLV
ncbi:MAG: hypothetical protein O3C09_05060, partial [Proteobacteria bacterium]|nr:hypothetical protein [Pseudomonadota bacterium]